MIRKQHAASQGIVASENLDTIYQREIFFPVDPMTLDWIDAQDLANAHPSGFYLEMNLERLLEHLPELEAEIFWLVFEKKKHQKDVAKLLGLSQPTVSYRYRRVLTKLQYLMTIVDMPIRETIEGMDFLKPHEKDMLFDLFYYLNQEMVGQKHGARQSSVKWTYLKARKKVAELERQSPEKWFKQMSILILLDQNFLIRVKY